MLQEVKEGKGEKGQWCKKEPFTGDCRDGSEGRGRETSINFRGMTFREPKLGDLHLLCEVEVLAIS